ncbi:hypothetical protein BX589_13371 [Paraburkholderia fungorum]|jgi:hypothetical protein|nr:hypothetical protein BX589_13371 [Paraburkholderia fungorum]
MRGAVEITAPFLNPSLFLVRHYFAAANELNPAGFNCPP